MLQKSALFANQFYNEVVSFYLVKIGKILFVDPKAPLILLMSIEQLG